MVRWRAAVHLAINGIDNINGIANISGIGNTYLRGVQIMARINIYETETDEYGTVGERALVGWFDPNKAEQFDESTTWDGNNNVSNATNSATEHQILYRTSGGRWVLHGWSQWQGVAEWYTFLPEDKAREWLLKQNQDAAVERFFGPVAEETGPAPVGRPEVGGVVNVRLGALLTQVDAEAARAGESRAETIRRLLAAALA